MPIRPLVCFSEDTLKTEEVEGKSLPAVVRLLPTGGGGVECCQLELINCPPSRPGLYTKLFGGGVVEEYVSPFILQRDSLMTDTYAYTSHSSPGSLPANHGKANRERLTARPRGRCAPSPIYKLPGIPNNFSLSDQDEAICADTVLNE